MTELDGTGGHRHRPGRATRWLALSTSVLAVPAVTALTLTGHTEIAGAVAAVAMAAAVPATINITVRHHYHR
ncbi:hypothetical protein AB0J25_23445 [Streptomyces sp. NPDC049910]|uniref:hypothetical protein n=1 Tax=Streptomyces sp. NPDC049910 TaxID=3155278 RepID=UPI0034403D70